MDLLLPELLLMASLSLLLAFFLARLISVAAATPSRPSPGDDRRVLRAAAKDDDRPSSSEDLLPAAAGDRVADAATVPGAAGEGEAEQHRERGEEPVELQGRGAAPLAEEKGVDDRGALDDGGRWREVEIVGAGEEEEMGLASDRAAGVLEMDEEEQQGKKRRVREVHVISAREPEEVEYEEEQLPKPTATTEDYEAGTAATITIPPGEGEELLSEEVRPSGPGSIAEAEAEGGVVPKGSSDPGPIAEAEAESGVVPKGSSDPSPISKAEAEADNSVVPKRSSDRGPIAEAEAEAESSAVPVRQVKTVVLQDEIRLSGDEADEDDDWEGIEASELGKLFSVAASFVVSPAGAEAVAKLPADVQLQLHGLHKAATEGPCFEAQPMPLKIGARAKWHAWQKLGDMNPEVAMEQYIAVLSENIPGWMVEKPSKESMQGESSNDSSELSQSLIETERKSGSN